MTTKKRKNVIEPPRLNSTFKFWKDNRVDGLFIVTQKTLMTRFIEWKKKQLADEARGEKWWEYYYGSQLVRCFITDKEERGGFQSVFEDDDFNNIYETLRHLLDHK